MSEFKIGDTVVVRDETTMTGLNGHEGTVVAASRDSVLVDFPGYRAVPFKPNELLLLRVNREQPRFFKTGDKARVRPHLIDGVVTPLPTGTLEVTRDQTQADIYVQVRKWNGHFWEGYGINASDLELAEDEQAEPPTEPETPPVDDSTPTAFRVGDWVRLKPGHPWEGDVWAAQPGEVIGHRPGDPDWYEVRFLDAVVWHTPDAMEGVDFGGDVLDEVEPPKGAAWLAVAAAQHDGSIAYLLVEPWTENGGVARLWVRQHDVGDDGFPHKEPFALFPIALTHGDIDVVTRALRYVALTEATQCVSRGPRPAGVAA